MAYIENFEFILVAIFSGIIFQLNDKSMKILIRSNFCILISKQPEPIIDLARKGHKLQTKMAAIEILNFAYCFNLSALKRVRHVFSDMFVVAKLFTALLKIAKSKIAKLMFLNDFVPKWAVIQYRLYNRLFTGKTFYFVHLSILKC